MSEKSERTTAERITFIASLVILLGILGMAAWASFRVGNAQPEIDVVAHLDKVRETDTGFYVPITITNTGGVTAQDVVVTGELDTGEGEPETAEVTITFLAGNESEEAEMVFTTHPAEGDFTIGPTSYVQP